MSKRRASVKGYAASSLSQFSTASCAVCLNSPSGLASTILVLGPLSFSSGIIDETGDTLLRDGSELTRDGPEILLFSPLLPLLIGTGIDDWRLFVLVLCSVDGFPIPGKRMIPRIPRGESEFRSIFPRVLLIEMFVIFDGDLEGVFWLSSFFSRSFGVPRRSLDGGDLDIGS